MKIRIAERYLKMADVREVRLEDQLFKLGGGEVGGVIEKEA